jgi:parallel beta-helix repeat protein
MKHRLAVPAFVLGLMVLIGALAAPTLAAHGGKAKKQAAKVRTFEVCKHGCRYRTIQKAVDAAGSFKANKANAKVKAVVAIRPGKYVEGVVVDGTLKKKSFDGLTIKGAKKDRKKVVLEGKNAKGELGAAQNGIEAISVDRLVLENMWARNYQSNGFFIHASNEGGQHCDGYKMDNLLASANRSYGLFAKNCFGGKMLDSAGYHHGDSAFYVGETPCDSKAWTNHGVAPPPAPCQRKPKWTLLKNLRSYENVLGYSGTNSKYVKIVDSAFYNNGAGIVPNTLDSEGFEPNGWNVFENNDVFWNNYDYFLAGSKFHTVSGGLGQVAGATVNYPTGVGIVLYGSANTVVKHNNVFGNYKWGIASFSGPGEVFVANEGDDAKNINNQIVENTMGREGADPNGEYDLWNDATGGGNCWSANSANATFAPGNGKVPLSQIYPACPQAEVLADQVRSLNIVPGLQINLGDESDPKTILGYASSSPPQKQECSWVRRLPSHPPFGKFTPVEVAPQPGEVSCG